MGFSVSPTPQTSSSAGCAGAAVEAPDGFGDRALNRLNALNPT